MAAPAPAAVPYPAASDYMPLDEIVEQLRLTGHPASKTTIHRWIAQDGMPVQKRPYEGRLRTWVPFSDVLLAHKAAVDAGRLR